MEAHRERLVKIGLDAKTIDNLLKGKGALQSVIATLDIVNV